MAASLPCLDHLSSRWPSKSQGHMHLNQTSEWRCRQRSPFQVCDHSRDPYCGCVQILSGKSRGLNRVACDDYPIQDLLREHVDGAVVFQHEKKVPKLQGHARPRSEEVDETNGHALATVSINPYLHKGKGKVTNPVSTSVFGRSGNGTR